MKLLVLLLAVACCAQICLSRPENTKKAASLTSNGPANAKAAANAKGTASLVDADDDDDANDFADEDGDDADAEDADDADEDDDDAADDDSGAASADHNLVLASVHKKINKAATTASHQDEDDDDDDAWYYKQVLPRVNEPGGGYRLILTDLLTKYSGTTSFDMRALYTAVSAATRKAAIFANTYYRDNVQRLQPSNQRNIESYVTYLKAQAPKGCKRNYRSTYATFNATYSEGILSCARDRFGALIDRTIAHVRTFVDAEMAGFFEDLQVAEDGGTEFAPDLVSAGSQVIPRMVDQSVLLNWMRQSDSYIVCLAANDDQARQGLKVLSPKVRECKKTGF